MTLEAIATHPETRPTQGTTPKTKEFEERIGVVLFFPDSSGTLQVLMQHIDRPTDDIQRRWKLPQEPITTKESDRPNGLNVLMNTFGLKETEVELWDVLRKELDDEIPDEFVAGKGYKRTIVKWTSWLKRPGANIVTRYQTLIVPKHEVVLYCQKFRIPNYTTALEMLPDSLEPPLH